MTLLVSFLPADQVKLTISAEPSHSVDWGKLMSGNNALWFPQERLEDAETSQFLEDWQPSMIRIPGGSWSDEFFWNGNGVREGEKVDSSKFIDGKWQVDYSAYKPGFHVKDVHGGVFEYQGAVDIKYLHEFNKKRGFGTMATVNAGTATAQDAAEWVKWAKKNDYRVDYWEVGNELEGDWEVGHTRPDGSKMTAEKYAEIFLEYITAMKAANPSAKVGGPVCSNATLPFVEVLIKEAGHVMDFVSFHTYPIEGQLPAEERYKLASVKKPVAQIRDWIKQYHPERVGEIEIGITEWHVQVAETLPTVDLTSGLWSALFLKSLAEEGVDFACQWDMYSTSKSGAGGHGFLDDHAGKGLRAQGQVFKMLRHGMGSEIYEVKGDTETLKCLATQKDGKPAVLLVNTSDQTQGVELSGLKLPKVVRTETFSQREYFWNFVKGQPEWTFPALVENAVLMNENTVGVPGNSLVLVSTEKSKATPPPASNDLEVKIHLPSRVETTFPIQGAVTIQDKATGRPIGNLYKVALKTSNGTLSEQVLTIEDGVGVFALTAGSEGEANITAKVNEKSISHQVELYKPKEKTVKVWNYENNPQKHIGESISSYELKVDSEAIPNSSLLSVVLKDAKALNNANTLIQPKSLDLPFEKKHIRGVTLTIGKSADFQAPEGATLSVVLQSEVNHWIPLRNISFNDLQKPGHDEFTPIEMKLPFSAKDQQDAMSQLYNVLLALNTDAPVNGKLYVQSLGFIVGEE